MWAREFKDAEGQRGGDLEPPADWLIRANHNRALPDGDVERLWARVLATEPLG